MRDLGPEGSWLLLGALFEQLLRFCEHLSVFGLQFAFGLLLLELDTPAGVLARDVAAEACVLGESSLAELALVDCGWGRDHVLLSSLIRLVAFFLLHQNLYVLFEIG